MFALVATTAPASARDDGVPLQLTLTVVPPSDVAAPRPTGSVIVAIDGSPLLSLELVGGMASLTAITPQIFTDLMALGRHVTIRYSGDTAGHRAPLPG